MENKERVHNKKTLKDIRRTLRKEATFAEVMIWEKLRGRKLFGLKFNRQHSIGNYIVDFYCAELKLVIELDGSVHNDPDQKQKDIERDKNLNELNFKVLRFSNTTAANDFDEIVEQIKIHYQLIKQS